MESIFYIDLKDKFTLVNALVAYKLNADEKERKRADELLRRVLGSGENFTKNSQLKVERLNGAYA
ncbi:hypothetical protein [Hydrogenimonas thermophila]|uniref:Uncharacterized protein n=1 Tax=Hydrogenimonas thermophila TaxID=223786 RepID=A0A1I5RTW7_9BACT|nr:hypothetical protein [Hydrogenimonas thermophila]SFP61396.1 hypothetical protein SAMN05216234_12838 [Hydrogenimonas thermophila]